MSIPTATAQRPKPGRTRALAGLGGVLAVALALAGCTGTSADSGNAGSTLTVAIPVIGTQDWGPATSTGDNEKMLMMVGNNLVSLDPATGAFVPELAESWELSEDGTVWTFHLRPDVQFHGDQGTMTAEDVKYSWEQWAGPQSLHTTQPQYAQAVGENMDNFEIVDDLTFALTTDKPIVHLLALVCTCGPGMTVVPKKYYEEGGDEAQAHPIGTGPWEFVSSTPGEELVLKAFDDYWGERPSVDNLILKEIPDGAARLLQVQAGDVDMAQLDGNLVGEVEANPDLTLQGIPFIANAWVSLGGMYPGHEAYDVDSPWIQADNPEAGLAVREAMSLAIDRELILETVLSGTGQLAYGPLIQYPQNPALIDDGWDLPAYDPGLAVQKLAEGGYADGFEVEMPIFSGDVDTGAVSEAIAVMWEQTLGLTVNRVATDEDSVEEIQDNYGTAGMAWVALTPFAPEPALSIQSYQSGQPDNIKFFHPAIDAGYQKMSVEPSLELRYQYAREMIDALRTDLPVLTLFSGDMLFVLGPRVESWTPIPGLNTVNGLESVVLTG